MNPARLDSLAGEPACALSGMLCLYLFVCRQRAKSQCEPIDRTPLRAVLATACPRRRGKLRLIWRRCWSGEVELVSASTRNPVKPGLPLEGSPVCPADPAGLVVGLPGQLAGVLGRELRCASPARQRRSLQTAPTSPPERERPASLPASWLARMTAAHRGGG